MKKHTYVDAQKQEHSCISFIVADGACGVFVIGVLPQAFLFPDFTNALTGTCGACETTLFLSDDSQTDKTMARTRQAACTRLSLMSGWTLLFSSPTGYMLMGCGNVTRIMKLSPLGNLMEFDHSPRQWLLTAWVFMQASWLLYCSQQDVQQPKL